MIKRDHAGGNKELQSYYPDVKIFGGEEKIEAMNQKVTEGDQFTCSDINIQVLSTPCHTSGHIVYFLSDLPTPVLFSGDTLFVGGLLIFLKF